MTHAIKLLRIIFRCFLFVSITLLLTACGSNRSYDEHFPFYPVPAGSQVILHQKLTMLPRQARVFLQRGVLLSNGFDQYYPHCNFEVRALSDEVRTIAPDEFLIARVQEGFEEVVRVRKPIRVAALGSTAFYYADYPMVSRYIHLYLTSKRQPDMMRLTCHGAFDELPDADLPTVNEIREALGKIATLEFYPKAGVIK